MKTLIAIFLLVNNICYSQIDSVTVSWQFFSNRVNLKEKNLEFKHPLNSYRVPFIQDFLIEKQVFDTLLSKADAYDIKFSQMQSLKDMPQPDGIIYSNRLILYGRKDTIRIGTSQYIISDYLINKGESFTEHDCYDMYYLEGIGVFLIEDQFDFLDHLETGYDYYTLTSIKDKNGHELVSRKLLRSLTKAALKKHGW